MYQHELWQLWSKELSVPQDDRYKHELWQPCSKELSVPQEDGKHVSTCTLEY